MLAIVLCTVYVYGKACCCVHLVCMITVIKEVCVVPNWVCGVRCGCCDLRDVLM